MKIIFFGTPELASVSLNAIIEAGHDVCLVVTREDKPKGRGYKITASPVEALAVEKGIELYQPATLRSPEAVEKLSGYGADIFITAAYGRIFTKEILEIPPMGCVNIHASLLPGLRGASPINRAIINGDTEGGVTIMYMDEGIDTGDIILQKKTVIPDDMFFDEYYSVISGLGAEAIIEFLKIAGSGSITRTKQDHAAATHADKITKEETIIDFAQENTSVYNKIRGLSPVPCAYALISGKRVKIYKAKKGEGSGAPGKLLSAGKEGIEIACKRGSIIITELQQEGKKRMDAAAFCAGNKLL